MYLFNLNVNYVYCRSPLHWAAKRGHEKVTHFLLDQGADSELTTVKGETALQLAKTPEIRKLLGGK